MSILRLEPVVESTPTARHWVTEQLHDVPDDVIACAALLTSELVTNAVLHAATPFTVTLHHMEDRIRVDVADGNPVVPSIKDYAADLPMASADSTVAWANAHRDLAKGLIAALDQSIAWFDDDKNKDEAIDILLKLSHADRDQVAQSYDFTRKIGMYDTNNAISRTDLQHLIDAMKSIGDLQGVTVTPDQLVIADLTPLAP